MRQGVFVHVNNACAFEDQLTIPSVVLSFAFNKHF